jgi:hypothetical protein
LVPADGKQGEEMMFKKVVAVITLTALVPATALFAVDMPNVALVDCASAAEPVRVSAVLPPDAVSARAYFKAVGQVPEYYVDLHRANDGSMWAFLPSPLPTTKSFTYRVISKNAKGQEVSSLLFLTTTSATCPPHKINANEQAAASNLVIGLTTQNQPPVPAGFSCRGVVSYITATGDLKPNEECRRLAALGEGGTGTPAATGGTPGTATTAGGTTPATGGATGGTAAGGAGGGAGAGGAAGGAGGGTILNPATVIALTGGVVIGGLIEHHRQKNKKPVSPSRP